jgi:hypothetical protein
VFRFRSTRRHRRGPIALLVAVTVSMATVALLASAGVALAPNPPDQAAPVSVTFTTPLTGLTDGSTVGFHVDTTSGTLNGSTTSRICIPDAANPVNDSAQFGFNGERCVKPGGVTPGTGLTGADYSKSQGIFAGVTTSGALTHKVGTGTVSWVNDGGIPLSLTCNAANPCDLVIEVNISTAPGTVYFTQPVTFAAPATNPGPVANLTASAGNGQVSLDWDTPASDGNSPIDQYIVSQDGVALPPVFAPATSLLVTGLTNGTTYTFTVKAHNTAGFTSASPDPSASATPTLLATNVQQPITVTRSAGDLVLTQACNGAPDIYPDGSLAAGDITTLPGPVAYGAATQAGCTVPLGAAKLIKTGAGAGQFFRATGPINQVTVVDGRDTDPGWEALGSVTPFTRLGGGPVASFSGNNLGWTPASSDTGPLTSDDGTYDQVVTPGGVVTPKVTGTLIPVAGSGLQTTPQRLAIAAAAKGLGIAELDAGLTLLIPINAKTGNYQSLMTITVA